MTAHVVKPNELPTWADALNSLWRAYFNNLEAEDRSVPDGSAIKAEQERVQELHADGVWQTRVATQRG